MSKVTQNSGFTLVELIVVIGIILVLSAIAIINLQNTQPSARDVEREQDAQSIMAHLETYYNERNYSAGGTAIPTYPHTAQITDPLTLQGLSPSAYRAPSTAEGTNAITLATNTTETVAGVLPQPTVAQYVYQPLTAAGDLCTASNGPCVRCNLYWRTEVTNTVQKLASRNQQ